MTRRVDLPVTCLYLVEIGIDTDYEFFVKNSSSVTSTLNDIELIWNFSESVYEDDVSIVFELTTTRGASQFKRPVLKFDGLEQHPQRVPLAMEQLGER